MYGELPAIVALRGADNPAGPALGYPLINRNAPDALCAASIPCETCGQDFPQRRPWQRFCSTPCRRRNHRTQTRDAILTGMVATARALGYTKALFLAKLDSLWA